MDFDFSSLIEDPTTQRYAIIGAATTVGVLGLIFVIKRCCCSKKKNGFDNSKSGKDPSGNSICGQYTGNYKSDYLNNRCYSPCRCSPLMSSPCYSVRRRPSFVSPSSTYCGSCCSGSSTRLKDPYTTRCFDTSRKYY